MWAARSPREAAAALDQPSRAEDAERVLACVLLCACAVPKSSAASMIQYNFRKDKERKEEKVQHERHEAASKINRRASVFLAHRAVDGVHRARVREEAAARTHGHQNRLMHEEEKLHKGEHHVKHDVVWVTDHVETESPLIARLPLGYKKPEPPLEPPKRVGGGFREKARRAARIKR